MLRNEMSLVTPLLPMGIPCSSSGSSPWGLWVLAVRFPHPRAIPKLILGHWYVSWSHASLANLHIRLVVPCMHPMRMCSIDSVILHVPCSSDPGIQNHMSPTIWVLWIALNRYCCGSGSDSAFPDAVPYHFVHFGCVLVLLDC